MPRATAPAQAAAPEAGRDRQRIAKVMARAGLCSRRDAEEWIKAGRVQVNNVTLSSPALNVGADDEILVDGSPLRAKTRTRLFLFHKPRGYVTTAKDPQGRATIYDLLPSDLPRLITIGRLDMNTEGLLLLTNDGGLARLLELPATGWLRRYRVRAHGAIEPAQLAELANGITVDGMNYGPIEATLDRIQGANVWLTMGLREGKNREVKRVLEHFGLAVNRLIRVSFGPFQLAELGAGSLSEIKTRILKEQLGDEIARKAGLDFDAPIESEPPVAAVPSNERWPRDPRFEKPARAGASPGPRSQGNETEPGAIDRRRDRPEKGKRKHISVLRAERRAALTPQRTRIERTATADRKGREISVERLVTARPGRAKASRAPWQKRPDAAPRRYGASDAGADTRRQPRDGTRSAERPWTDKGPDKKRASPDKRPDSDARSAGPNGRRPPRGANKPAKRPWTDKGPEKKRPTPDKRPDSDARSAGPAGRRPPRGASKPTKHPWTDKGPEKKRATPDKRPGSDARSAGLGGRWPPRNANRPAGRPQKNRVTPAGSGSEARSNAGRSNERSWANKRPGGKRGAPAVGGSKYRGDRPPGPRRGPR
jgi:23S rRNA pseudouridine2605 synthase